MRRVPARSRDQVAPAGNGKRHTYRGEMGTKRLVLVAFSAVAIAVLIAFKFATSRMAVGAGLQGTVIIPLISAVLLYLVMSWGSQSETARVWRIMLVEAPVVAGLAVAILAMMNEVVLEVPGLPFEVAWSAGAAATLIALIVADAAYRRAEPMAGMDAVAFSILVTLWLHVLVALVHRLETGADGLDLIPLPVALAGAVFLCWRMIGEWRRPQASSARTSGHLEG